MQISADPLELEPIKNHVLRHFAGRAKVPGFREGRAPAGLVEKQIDQRAMMDDFLDHAINHFYRQAIRQEKLQPAGRPKIEVKKFVPYSQLEFEVELEAVGKISLSDYTKIRLPKKPIKITSKDVEGVIQSLSQKQARRTEVKRPARKGDEVVIDFAGEDEGGQPVNGASAKGYALLLGSRNFIPGFEEQLIGLKNGQDKTFSIIFPKDYNVTTLRNKKVIFKVNIKKVNELLMPKIDDTFAAKAGPFKSLTELKKDIKKQILAEKQNRAAQSYEIQLIKEITQAAKVEIPSILVDEEINKMEEEEKRNLAYQGQTWQEHLKAEGISAEQHRQKQQPQALERVKMGLVLSEIVEREKIQVLPEEVEQRIQLMKQHYKDQTMQAELDKPEARHEIAARLITEKTVIKLIEYASQ